MEGLLLFLFLVVLFIIAGVAGWRGVTHLH
jgi:hypothetical protein